MKRYLKPAYLPMAVLGAGVLAFLFRLWLFAIGKDDRGLLAVGNFPDAMSWIITALAMGLIFWVSRNLRWGNKYSYNFGASMPAAIGVALAAVSFVINSVIDLSAEIDPIGAVSALLGFLAAASRLSKVRTTTVGTNVLSES